MSQQTTDFLAQYDADHACKFPIFDTQIDNQKVRVSEPSPHLANTTKCSTCVNSSPKGTKAVEKAMLNSIPQKTREQTNWVVKLWSEWARA